jgi:hypothetical protein
LRNKATFPKSGGMFRFSSGALYGKSLFINVGSETNLPNGANRYPIGKNGALSEWSGIKKIPLLRCTNPNPFALHVGKR